MSLSTVMDALAMAGLALLSVGLWTARVALTSRGRRLGAATMAAVEATVFVVAFSRLLTGLDSPLLIASYAAGVAAGTVAALTVDDLLDPRMVRVDIVDPTGPARMLSALRTGRWPTTVSTGEGLTGPVAIISVTTAADELQSLTDAVADADTGAFWTVSPVSAARPVPVPAGYTQTASPRRRHPAASRRRLPRSPHSTDNTDNTERIPTP